VVAWQGTRYGQFKTGTWAMGPWPLLLDSFILKPRGCLELSQVRYRLVGF